MAGAAAAAGTVMMVLGWQEVIQAFGFAIVFFAVMFLEAGGEGPSDKQTGVDDFFARHGDTDAVVERLAALPAAEETPVVLGSLGPIVTPQAAADQVAQIRRPTAGS